MCINTDDMFLIVIWRKSHSYFIKPERDSEIVRVQTIIEYADLHVYTYGVHTYY